MTYKLDSDWQGWVEIVVGVQDPVSAALPLESGAGWERLVDGYADAGLSDAWRLPGNARVRERLVHVPQTYGGLVRFVSFEDLSPQRVRSADANPWDTGGLWLFNIRTRDADRSSARLVDAGYDSPRGVHKFEFEFLTVKECIHTGPDGMRVSMIEQVLPPIEPPEAYIETSRAFNTTIVCKDFSRTRAFFVEQLGFEPWIETIWKKDNVGLNLVAPRETFSEIDSMEVAIVHPQGGNLGSIELLGYQGEFEATDFACDAHPPALGNLMLRFYTENIDQKLSELEQNEVSILTGPNRYHLDPYGDIRSLIISTPDGVWLEYFEVLSA